MDVALREGVHRISFFRLVGLFFYFTAELVPCSMFGPMRSYSLAVYHTLQSESSCPFTWISCLTLIVQQCAVQLTLCWWWLEHVAQQYSAGNRFCELTYKDECDL